MAHAIVRVETSPWQGFVFQLCLLQMTQYRILSRTVFLSVLQSMDRYKLENILLASYFRTDHFILHPCSIHPSLWRVNFELLIQLSIRLESQLSIRLENYFRAVHLTPHPSICLASCFRADHFTFHLSIRWRVIFELTILFSIRPSVRRVIFEPLIELSIFLSVWRVIFELTI